MSCLVKMKAVREELSGSEKKIADFILSNSALIRDYSSQHLAGSVGVSQSSVVKFSQKLGYRGFTDLKLAIHEAVVISESQDIGHRKNSNGLQHNDESIFDRLLAAKQDALVGTMQLNDEARVLSAVEVLERSKRIQIVALGAGSLVARNFASVLLRLGKTVLSEMDTYNQLVSVAMLGKGDAAVIVTFSGQSNKMLQIAKHARKAGATVISLTNYSANPVRALADIELFTVTHRKGEFEIPGIVASTSQQHVVDLIVSKMVERDKSARELLLRSKKLTSDLI